MTSLRPKTHAIRMPSSLSTPTHTTHKHMSAYGLGLPLLLELLLARRGPSRLTYGVLSVVRPECILRWANAPSQHPKRIDTLVFVRPSRYRHQRRAREISFASLPSSKMPNNKTRFCAIPSPRVVRNARWSYVVRPCSSLARSLHITSTSTSTLNTAQQGAYSPNRRN